MKELFLLLDMDGVLVKDKALNPFQDTLFFIEGLRKRNIPFRVVSNNSTKPPKKILNELKEKGIVLEEEEFLSPLLVLVGYLRSLAIKRIFFIGMPAVKEFLQEEGFEISEDYNVDAVVIGQDRNIDFRKLKLATSAVFLKDALIIPINLSRIVKDDDGLYFPGAGSVAFAIAHACNYKREIPNLGKPSREFISLALKGYEGATVYMVSDDIYTDLIGAKELGLKTVFMTTGKYNTQELQRAGFEPDLTFDSLTDLLYYLDKAVLS